MSWCKAHTLRERIVRTSLRACHENRNRKNLVKLVLQKISLYRERVVTCSRQTRSPPLPRPLIAVFRYERGKRGMDRGSINGIRGIALPRTDPRQPRGARGGRDSLEITTPSRDVSLSLSLFISRTAHIPLRIDAPFRTLRLRFTYNRNYRVYLFVYIYIYTRNVFLPNRRFSSRFKTRN